MKKIRQVILDEEDILELSDLVDAYSYYLGFRFKSSPQGEALFDYLELITRE